MAELMSGRSPYSETMVGMPPTTPMATRAPEIDMVSNPQFVFPMRPQPSQPSVPFTPSAGHRRPMSFHTNSGLRPRTAESRHMRGVSALPSFSFSATDTSGLHAEQPDQSQQNDSLLATPRGGHRRNVSELVGGVGPGSAISSSPTKSNALPITPKGGHRHRRSTAISGHDLSFLMSPAEPQPRLSSSLPSTPLEHPGSMPKTPTANTDESISAALQDSPTRPPSRPRVEFSDNVEYIPRPLSTISSETGSSMSTVRGHSVNNSISSVLSLSTPSPPASRLHAHTRMSSLGTTPEDANLPGHRSSLDYRRRTEREGQWLKGESPDGSPRRPASQSRVEPPKLAFALDDSPAKQHSAHRKRQSIGHALGFDRRRSEPVMGMHAGEPSRLSALSLQEPAHEVQYDQEDPEFDSSRRSSTRRIKDWAVSKISRIAHKPQGDNLVPKVSSSTGSPSFPDTAPAQDEPVAETDLDAVFSQGTEISQPSFTQVFPSAGLGVPSLSQRRSFPSPDMDDYGSMLDLDAALGPFNTPSSGAQKQRRGLHSSRGARDFAGQSSAYTPSHGRTYSAPVLSAFDQGRSSSPPQAAMADVFEEEEEDEVSSAKATRPESSHDEDSALGVHMVDSADVDSAGNTTQFSIDDGLQLGAAWEPEQSSSFTTMSARLSTPIPDRRPQSIIEDTILEESSPVEPAIVESHEEPRAPSLTKSSDSSEAPTIMAASTGMLGLPEGAPSLTTPETYQSSEFSSPDMGRRQSSFDTSRLGTSASSMTDNRTMSSYTTGDQSHDLRVSTDDIPSLTSSRSTMLSTMHANTSRRDVCGSRTPSVISNNLDPAAVTARRRKRNSIQSLSQLVGAPFGSSRGTDIDEMRPRTAIDMVAKKPKEHRLKKLMFWKSKHRESSSTSTVL